MNLQARVVVHTAEVLSKVHLILVASTDHQVANTDHRVVSTVHRVVSTDHQVVSTVHRVANIVHQAANMVHQVTSMVHQVLVASMIPLTLDLNMVALPVVLSMDLVANTLDLILSIVLAVSTEVDLVIGTPPVRHLVEVAVGITEVTADLLRDDTTPPMMATLMEVRRTYYNTLRSNTLSYTKFNIPFILSCLTAGNYSYSYSSSSGGYKTQSARQNEIHPRQQRDVDGEELDWDVETRCGDNKCVAIKCTAGPLADGDDINIYLRSRVKLQTLQQVNIGIFLWFVLSLLDFISTQSVVENVRPIHYHHMPYHQTDSLNLAGDQL